MEQLTSAAPAIWNGFITSTWFITQWKVRLIGRDSSELGLPSPTQQYNTSLLPCCLAQVAGISVLDFVCAARVCAEMRKQTSFRMHCMYVHLPGTYEPAPAFHSSPRAGTPCWLPG